MEYNDIVKTDEQTCWACPTQWEGTLKDGRSFYFRYRWGTASLGVAPIGEDPVLHPNTTGEQLGDGLDGVLSTDDYRASFVRLFSALELA